MSAKNTKGTFFFNLWFENLAIFSKILGKLVKFVGISLYIHEEIAMSKTQIYNKTSTKP